MPAIKRNLGAAADDLSRGYTTSPQLQKSVDRLASPEAQEWLLPEAVARLQRGAIVAIKGLGGFHLACDARNEGAVARLRARKAREEKPFAVMVANVPSAQTWAEVEPAERTLMESVERGIVLLRKRSASDRTLASVASRTEGKSSPAISRGASMKKRPDSSNRGPTVLAPSRRSPFPTWTAPARRSRTRLGIVTWPLLLTFMVMAGFESSYFYGQSEDGAQVFDSAGSDFYVTAGTYEVACKPGQQGDGIRQKLAVIEAVAKAATAGTGDYPEGSVVQLMPNEVMIKQQKGYSPITRDWEFFWIDVDKNGVYVPHCWSK